jgi:hypothetical protein
MSFIHETGWHGGNPIVTGLHEWDERVLAARRVCLRGFYRLRQPLDTYFNLSCWDGCEAKPKFVSTCSTIGIEYFSAHQGYTLREC